eukprot:TRINITY_DN962_c0_g1_i1.p1 TRINITY_DN962_c0_g1~~TRINITY_DN962_c0_g1_i1.p1  ORF type:complete len:225 (+),score=59.34 TRINITY_DN962_c0_g1_i1:239-913(+)
MDYLRNHPIVNNQLSSNHNICLINNFGEINNSNNNQPIIFMQKEITMMNYESEERLGDSNDEMMVASSPKRNKMSQRNGKRHHDQQKPISDNKMRKKEKIKKERIKLHNLFTEGYILEGQSVIYRNRTGKINTKGIISYKDKSFTSPSGWATEINKELGGSNSTRPNGWHDVYINGHRLSSIRDKFISNKKIRLSNVNPNSSFNYNNSLDILAHACIFVTERKL